MKLACLYLARYDEDCSSIKKFIASYQKHAAGIDHSLVVVFKGNNKRQLREAKLLFSDTPHQAIIIDDKGYDIGVYLKVSRELDYSYICFLNTHSRILTDGWLAALYTAVTTDGVGMAGASASYESLPQTYRYVDQIVYQYLNAFGRLNPIEQRYHGWILELFARRLTSSKVKYLLYREFRFLLHRLYKPKKYRSLSAFLSNQFGKGGQREWTLQFNGFPNVHLRTNAFIISTELLNDLNFEIPFDKVGCYHFESGPKGLSTTVMQKGLEIVVCGADGRVFKPHQWPMSDTFRSGSQQNLLVSDNQTRAFEILTKSQQITYKYITWGNAIESILPLDFPKPELNFQVETA